LKILKHYNYSAFSSTEALSAHHCVISLYSRARAVQHTKIRQIWNQGDHLSGKPGNVRGFY